MPLDPTKTFESLECWKACRDLRGFLREHVFPFLPKHEFYDLRSQMLRAGRSTTANIAEGNGRYHFLENRKFCLNARGSLYELLDHLIATAEEKYITPECLALGREKILHAVKILNGYLSWISKQHETANS